MAGRLGCTTGDEGEVGSSSNKVHLGEEEGRLAARGRMREEF